MKKIELKEGLLFRRVKFNQGWWHIRDERCANGPATPPFCSRSGKYSYSTAEAQVVKRVCPECLALARKHGRVTEVNIK